MSATLVCTSCGADVPSVHKFCGKCGNPMAGPPPEGTAKTAFLGSMPGAGKAKLILIRGEGMDGVSYHLNAAEHLAGRKSGAILFPEDNYLSPRHANFFYEGGRLHARDEGSLNGIFTRVREPALLRDGDVFLAGEELLRVDLTGFAGHLVGPDDTHFFASPPPPSPYCITQIFEGGRAGLRLHARDESISIGREGCDLNFGQDRFISGRHCRVEFGPHGAVVSDLQSRNGTYVRVQGQRELRHGDYLFLGKQLLRVEIAA